MRIFYMLLLTLLYAGEAQSQPTDSLRDGVYFEDIRPIDKAILNQDFVRFRQLYTGIYAHADTTDYPTKLQYIDDTYTFAELLALDGKEDSAITAIAGIIYYPQFDNADGILGSVAFDHIRKRKEWVIFSEFARKKILSESAGCTMPYLRLRLLSLAFTDQSNILYNNSKKDTNKRIKIQHDLADSISRILNEFDYPTPEYVGKKAARVPALILAHADLKTQLLYKDKIYQAGLQGKVPDGYAGILLDKIQVAQKHKQLYGTQYEIKPDKTVYFYPIGDSVNVEKRRTQLGFEISFKDYKNAIIYQAKRYGTDLK